MEQDVASGFGSRLRNLRESRSYRQDDIAELFGMNKSAVSQWENGRIPHPTIIAKLADFFNVSTDFLLCRTESPQLVPEKKQTPADTAGENIGLPAELHQRVISALDNMDPERADEIVQRIESAAALFPKETKDAPAKKMA